MKIHWILLAAGLSRRFGENKLLYPVNGKKLYRYSLERMAALAEKRQERLVVVTSHEAIRQELAGKKAEGKQGNQPDPPSGGIWRLL